MPVEVQPGPLWVADDLVEQAAARFDAGEYRGSHELALKGLAARPDDVRLLQLAGRSSLELNLDVDEPIALLERAAQLDPGNADAWQNLSLALVNAGKPDQAVQALHEVLRRRPQDTTALIDLAHSSYALGQVETAIDALRRVTEIEPGHIGARRSLLEMYRALGRRADALEAAQAIAGQVPGDVVATLDMAELNLELGNYSAALGNYGRLVNIDPEPQHAMYAYHGMIHTEIQRASWRRALTLTIDATRFDRDELTTQLLAFVAARLFGETGRPSLAQVDVEHALTSEHAEHRRAHLELLAEV